MAAPIVLHNTLPLRPSPAGTSRIQTNGMIALERFGPSSGFIPFNTCPCINTVASNGKSAFTPYTSVGPNTSLTERRMGWARLRPSMTPRVASPPWLPW